MKAKKFLFVGGPSDGLRREDPSNGSPTVQTINSKPTSYSFRDIRDPQWDVNDVFDVQTSTYTRKHFVGENGKVYEAFFHSDVKDPMEALVKGYRYHRNKRRRFYKVKNPPRYDMSGRRVM